MLGTSSALVPSLRTESTASPRLTWGGAACGACPRSRRRRRSSPAARPAPAPRRSPMRWVKLTLPPWVSRRSWLLTIRRLTSSSLAGTVRTEVAVGTARLSSIRLAIGRRHRSAAGTRPRLPPPLRWRAARVSGRCRCRGCGAERRVPVSGRRVPVLAPQVSVRPPLAAPLARALPLLGEPSPRLVGLYRPEVLGRFPPPRLTRRWVRRNRRRTPARRATPTPGPRRTGGTSRRSARCWARSSPLRWWGYRPWIAFGQS